MPDSLTQMNAVRLDQWLWAARFYKTRMLAKKAVLSGKVRLNGEPCKPAALVHVGDVLTIRQGFAEKTVAVKALSLKRSGAPDATLLYQESEASKEKREQAALLRKLAGTNPASKGRPTKRDRRKIIRFLRMSSDETNLG